MVLREPDVDAVLGQIGNVAFERCNVLTQSIANQNPTSMRPPLAIKDERATQSSAGTSQEKAEAAE